MVELLFYSLLAGLFSLLGGLFLVWKPNLTHHFLTPLIAFGAGAFLSAAILDMLPEALEASNEAHPVLWMTMIGFVAFFILERFIMKFVKTRLSHEHSDHTESLPILLILGDSFHNFLDGTVIALTYVANPALALPTALAIAAHEIPQEIGDFAVLIKQGWKKSTIITVNVLQSLITIPGVFLGYYLGHIIEGFLPLLLGLAVGIFLYIAASDLIPEVHHRAGHKHFFSVVLPMVLAIGLISTLSQLVHGH